MQVKGKYENITESKALGYFVGVIDGDGSAFIANIKNRRKRYRISLRVKDKDFSEKFQRCIFEVTGNSPNIYYYKRETCFGLSKQWFIVFDSKNLYNLFYNKKLYYAKKYSIQYLKGIYDSEGCVSLSCKMYLRIRLSNTDINIIELSQKLLKLFEINSTYRKVKTGCYRLLISRKDNQKFINHVGFSINRKHERLIGNKEYFTSERYKNG